ncbi:MAG: S8 family serine peptidase [Actinomycetota bacterium]|nr:S8 family serine peptidase [Actinomycetota bacterium]
MTVTPAWAKASAILQHQHPPELMHVTPQWAWGGATGAGVRVAVIDSGIDAEHPALEGCIDQSAAVCFELGADGEVVPATGPHTDAYGHGTACASIIHQLAPGATITSLRVLGSNNTGKVGQFVAALAWAIDHGYDVINLSLGTRLRDWALTFHELCDRAYFGNSLVVTAANNRNTPSYPSLYASALSVACNTTADPFRYHANPQPPTEFLARGIDIEVAWRDLGYSRVTGNSFAAPHLAGIAALIRSKHPGLRPFQLKSALWACAANVRGDEPLDVAGRVSRTRTIAAVGARGTATTAAIRAR